MRFEKEGDVNFQLSRLLNGGLEFGDNMRGSLIEVVLQSGMNPIRHGLDTVPNGYIVLYKDKPGDVWASTTVWDNSVIYLNSSVNNMRVRLFIL